MGWRMRPAELSAGRRPSLKGHEPIGFVVGEEAMLFENMPVITGEEVECALRFSAEQVVRNLPEFTYKFQKAYSEDGFYQPI